VTSGIIDRVGEPPPEASPIHEIPIGMEIERMNIINSTTTKKAAAAATDTAMLTPEQFIEQLRAMQQQLPEFVQLPKLRGIGHIRRVANMATELAHDGIGAISVSETVQSAIGQTAEQMHQAEDEIGRWAVAENEARTLLRGLSAANLVRRHRIGLALMQVYNVSRQLVRQEEHAHLLPHVERMSQVRKLGRRRIKAETEPQTEPQVKPTA
jgi:hypothetical protein